MTATPDTNANDPWAQLPEEIAPPQANGELLFEAPWQGRAFGMVHTLVDAGQFSWDEFREQLIVALDGGAVGADRYYECLLLALERSLELPAGEVAARVQEFEQRPHGHDH